MKLSRKLRRNRLSNATETPSDPGPEPVVEIDEEPLNEEEVKAVEEYLDKDDPEVNGVKIDAPEEEEK